MQSKVFIVYDLVIIIIFFFDSDFHWLVVDNMPIQIRSEDKSCDKKKMLYLRLLVNIVHTRYLSQQTLCLTCMLVICNQFGKVIAIRKLKDIPFPYTDVCVDGPQHSNDKTCKCAGIGLKYKLKFPFWTRLYKLSFAFTLLHFIYYQIRNT